MRDTELIKRLEIKRALAVETRAKIALERCKKRYANSKAYNIKYSYLKNKVLGAIIPESIRVDFVESTNGVELIPMMDIDGTIWNLQRIYKKDGKCHKFLLMHYRQSAIVRI